MTLGEMLHLSAVKFTSKAAIVCAERSISYAALDEATDALARWLLQQDLRPGDRVGIHWTNSIETVTLYFACFKSGLIAVPINNRFTGKRQRNAISCPVA
jgi:long-chain acyl-CoA synthetase